ncbi:FK506-binding protein 15 isoform X3 [Empidonax traillii]|uniref:FK506-binding protein 15 isoform X2 n=1 Tax=Empidonax traillii TaxID=164674 RepID=UPI000FFD071D|nr:FK506-binding protein 15 isoform X2 [Empidonax traillii]XP_027760915.1 FK506-binding protein 15 isoform X3 [Empidonax traillii]
MFGPAEEDDADFLSPASGARLASLFGLDQTVSGQGNEFFQFTAPKQPKKGQAAAGQPQKAPVAPAAPAVLVATAVLAYRYANGQYLKQGKYGAAVVGNHAAKEYRILLYISQQQQITTARIHPGFVLTVQPNNYSTFYDDQRQNWSIMFESEKAAMDFSKQVCIAKCNSSPVLESVLYQDLLLGEGQGVEAGDSLEVAYTGWLFQNNGLGQVFDSNVNKDKLLRLKLGSGKVIKGWEEGMMGMKKGGRRYLIIPPAWAYGAQGVPGRVPPDSTLVFEVEVKRVKLAKECSASDGLSVSSRDSPAPSPVPSSDGFSADTGLMPPSTIPPKPGEPAVRAKSNSISEQLANPDVAKAKLISRMAKMGQPMLPFLAGTAGGQLDSSDSEIEDPNTLRGTAQPVAPSAMRPSQPAQAVLPTVSTQVPQASGAAPSVSSAALIPATIQPHSALPGGAQGFQAYPGMAFAYPQTAASASQLQPVGQMYPAPYQAPGDVTSFLMTEARQHNTEIRLAVSKVVDKMDHLAAKVEELKKQSSANSSLLPGISSVTMEASMIMSNIQRIIQENERLKQEIFEKSSRIEEQNEKISELIERNQRYVEQSNLLMEQRNHSLQTTNENTQARVLHAEQEKHMLPVDRGWDQAKVAEELAAATAQVSQLQLELTAHQKQEMALRKQLSAAVQEAERHEAQLNKLQAQVAELQEASEDTQSRFKAEKQSRKQLDLKITALEEELTDLKVEKETLERNLAERKKKSLSERAQAEEEMEEIRRSYQQELDKLRQLLKKARTSTDQAAAEQLSLIQAELESQWEAKCERALASAKEQHARQYQEVCEQRDSLQQQLAQLEEKLTALKHSKKAEEQKLSEVQQRLEELEPIQEKFSALQADAVVLKARYEERIRALERDQEGSSPADFTEEVKKIMNSVFQSLRGEFELEETYSGRTVLGVVMNTIKTVTLQLLNRQQEKPDHESEKEESGTVRQKGSLGAKTDQQESVQNSPAQSVAFPADPGETATGPRVSEQEGKTAPHSARPGTPEEEQETWSNGVAEEEKVQGEHLSPTAKSHLDPEKGPVHAGQPIPEEEHRQESNPLGKAEPEHSPSRVSLQAEVAEPSVPEAKPEVDVAAVEQKAEEAVGGLEPPPLNGEEGSGSEPWDGAGPEKEQPASVSSTAELGSAVTREAPGQQELGSSPRQGDSSLFEDDNFFETASPKPLKPQVPSEEEDEEEVSMKGRPPPAPLFGDDDDDDLDWLG